MKLRVTGMKLLVAVFVILLNTVTVSAAGSNATSTITAVIDKAAPPFKFVIKGSVAEGDVEAINVVAPSGAKIQTIPFPQDAQEPDGSLKLLEFMDINFDGYHDLLLLVGYGTIGEVYEAWVYEPKRKRFVKSNIHEGLPNPSVDSKQRILTTVSSMGCCDTTTSHYRYLNGRFDMFMEERTYIEKKREVTVVKKKIDGKWKVVKKSYGDRVD